ncbi:hypothetical protein C450_09407 [Halococcus salifodinae DSM 8989]|uniref:Uncharacterized protein n=1 Tax=Halococcus salifodinae DSM 8989 TaxID=1227456 RepID=M0N6P9_9EURY|nr:hypothetical protein C450_09407 [Halococcus salifodinae DSM 8989]
MRRETTARLVRLLVRWGVIPHPYGRNYAKCTIGPLGRCREIDGSVSDWESFRDGIPEEDSRTDDSSDP